MGLRDHTIDGFRLCIYKDKSKPFNVLETYTFSFRYTGHTRRQLVGMAQSCSSRESALQLEGPADANTSMEDAWSNIEKFMRGLQDFHQTLPDLPSQSLTTS